MSAFALLVEYDGAPFVGWQRQSTGLSIQQVIEEAAAHLNGGEPPLATAAGRTDAGVHAEAQVVQVEIGADLPADRVRDALNFHARPHPVVVRSAIAVAPGWSPRFDATGRAYRYRILNRRARPALDFGRVWHVQRPLDAGAMHRAAQGLLGRHDFSAYRAASCQAKSPLRTLDRLDVARLADEVVIVAEARSFLHHQVRNLVGTLAEVGMGRRPETWPRAVLDGRDRARAGQTAPPEGLTLTAVRYDPPIDWV
ncbi:tRNA pseudouridine(38-40) synthase TruA [Roseomonas fluvialis]|uniref:tRNA pseudouridine synthase A n=1 Tax=Roseomonas fluvialis TaxID=1750527 RepID=A0ABM7XXJ3_9PROT|nr:tRNA pseudouridine(38-40) synthase TruA [Roseomonas fluvialis]BDG70198.1 tRNA pseudouridine synthase A [Roseomonas fluvialis]